MPVKNKSACEKKKPSKVIEVRDLNFGFGGERVLENISFDIGEGEYLGIVGPNGAGKTTLLKILLGLKKPQKGTVKIFGEDVAKIKNRSIIGYVAQKSAQIASEFPATVEEIVSSGRTARIGLFRKAKAEDRQKIEEAMKLTEVYALRRRLISELSGGQKQRVFIARALAAEPKILFLDEPTVAVDVALSRKFYELLNKLNKELGITILFVSHDLDVIAREVNSVLCLKRTLVCHGSPADFMTRENLEKLYGPNYKIIVHHKHDS